MCVPRKHCSRCVYYPTNGYMISLPWANCRMCTESYQIISTKTPWITARHMQDRFSIIELSCITLCKSCKYGLVITWATFTLIQDTETDSNEFLWSDVTELLWLDRVIWLVDRDMTCCVIPLHLLTTLVYEDCFSNINTCRCSTCIHLFLIWALYHLCASKNIFVLN